MLGHAEAAHLVGAKDLGHLLVGDEVLLVVGILQVVLLEVSPKLFDAFGTARFLLANDVSQFGGELHGFGETGSFRHGDLR